MPTNKAYLALGTNKGDRNRYLDQALSLLGERVGLIVLQSSRIETAPEGFESENAFLNMAVCLETSHTAIEVLHLTQEIEKELGRTHKSVHCQYADREIDIDLLYFNREQINTEELILPHPRLHKRQFVLLPLSEIAPKLKHPIIGKNTLQLLENLKKQS